MWTCCRQRRRWLSNCSASLHLPPVGESPLRRTTSARWVPGRPMGSVSQSTSKSGYRVRQSRGSLRFVSRRAAPEDPWQPKRASDDPDGRIHRSFALHELKRTKEAQALLLPAFKKFPGHWTIPYNLACYCAQLGELDESQQWLKAAMSSDESRTKRMAIDDPDLKPLWDSMSGTLWIRE